MKNPTAKPKKSAAKTRRGPISPARGGAKASGSGSRAIEKNAHYDALVLLRNQVIGMVRNISASTLTSTKQAGEELADIGSDNFSREVGLAMMTEDGRKLAMIQEAMDRLAAGSYGTCSVCGKKISEARLKALPYADLCVDCQGLEEEQQKMSQLSPMEFALSQEQEQEWVSKEGEGEEEGADADAEKEEAAGEEEKPEKGAGDKPPVQGKAPPSERGKERAPVRPVKALPSKASQRAPAASKPAKPARAKPVIAKVLTTKTKTKVARPRPTAVKKSARAVAKPAKAPVKRVQEPVVTRGKVKSPKTASARKPVGRSAKRAKK